MGLEGLERPSSPFVKRAVRGPKGSYSTYPHANGFLPDGRCVVAVETTLGKNTAISYNAFNLVSGEVSEICTVAGARAYFAISDNGIMAIPKKFGISIIDISSDNKVERNILFEPGWTVAQDLDISRDGSRVLASRTKYKYPQDFDIIEIGVNVEDERNIVSPGWQMDHAHYSPFDQAWVCYAQNAQVRQRSLSRMWVWHAKYASSGRHIFNQTFANGTEFVVSHERAMFHKGALLTIAHGASSATPRGLYEVDFDGNSRLVSESNRDNHCNISRDGRWAVVSLQGAGDEVTDPISRRFHGMAVPARVKPNWPKISGNIGYAVSDVQIVDMVSGRREFLFRGTNDLDGQPYEVQPCISPDGKWVIVKDAYERCVIALEMNQLVLGKFLNGR
ncbi:hypothetical protein [Sphingobium yanoikuyae]|uniref:hypothetical protein n=1 Tax=Sphingobium yanoikuyae TaxID=13690 RepID=UPI0035B42C2C